MGILVKLYGYFPLTKYDLSLSINMFKYDKFRPE